jgi:small multidrug resistance pump
MKKWHDITLKLAGIYNIIWAVFVIFWPFQIFKLSGMELPLYPELWQCIGMIVGVYGLGYWIASYDPYKHWPIIFVGLMGKVFGPIGFLKALYLERFNYKFGLVIITNDLIWIIPFFQILWISYKKDLKKK